MDKNKTLEEIILEKLEKAQSFDDFKSMTGLNNQMASDYWMNKKLNLKK